MTNPQRHPQGAPASQGGQFAAHPAPESGVDLLVDGDPETLDDVPLRAHAIHPGDILHDYLDATVESVVVDPPGRGGRLVRLTTSHGYVAYPLNELTRVTRRPQPEPEQVRAHRLQPGDVLPALDEAVIATVERDPAGQEGMVHLTTEDGQRLDVPLNLPVQARRVSPPAWLAEPRVEAALGRPVAELPEDEKTALGRLITTEDGDFDPCYLAPFADGTWEPVDIGLALDTHLADEVEVHVAHDAQTNRDAWEVRRRARDQSRARVEWLHSEDRDLACVGRTTNLDRAVAWTVLVTEAYDRAGDPATRSGWSVDTHRGQ